MSLYSDYVEWKRMIDRAETEMPEAEAQTWAVLTVDIIERSMDALMQCARIFDENLDDDECWEEGQIIDALASHLRRIEVFVHCNAHGDFARSHPDCPICTEEAA